MVVRLNVHFAALTGRNSADKAVVAWFVLGQEPRACNFLISAPCDSPWVLCKIGTDTRRTCEGGQVVCKNVPSLPGWQVGDDEARDLHGGGSGNMPG